MARTRRGFTLVELLMVIVVIGILSTLLVAGGLTVLSSSRAASTRSTLEIAKAIIDGRQKTLETAIRDQTGDPISAFRSQFSTLIQSVQSNPGLTPAQQADISGRIQNYDQAAFARMSIIGPNATNEAKRTVVLQEWMRLILPQTWAEADFQLCMKHLPKVTDPVPATENAEVICFVLMQGKSIGSISFEGDADALGTGRTRDTDGNGRPEIIDGWGNPIRFVRWPTRILRPNGMPSTYKPRKVTVPPDEYGPDFSIVPQSDLAAASVYFKPMPTSGGDAKIPNGSNSSPDDSLNLLPNMFVQDSQIVSGDTSGCFETLEQNYRLPSTYHRPIMYSSGPDGTPGITNPVDTSSFNYWGKIDNAQASYDDLAK